MLAAADQHAGTNSRRALEELIQAYWFPLYAFVRRQGALGKTPAEAEDLVQEFFARLLEKKYLAQVDRSKGKFRSFLLAAMKHFLSKERARLRTQKRGAGRAVRPPLQPDSASRIICPLSLLLCQLSANSNQVPSARISAGFSATGARIGAGR